MSNKDEGNNPIFLWHRLSFKNKLLLCVAAVLWTSFAFGLGTLMVQKGDRAPIIIEQCGNFD
ncbi:MAG: hypothetical protein PHS16_03235 [Candidatus Colwellbacteria bacterium]|jgi:hypothetical protein|nr:hypothetical protein [Candidatus Colwellbacteria bacterium]MCK9497766.1 hypothetical protein [Candidatus Colwellbacteria bacterium]MDD3752918.1 hypothetical protein [Candidatus Colwellbacteria bacterium]MDD4819189.1 hypothetical protein [Candidatus Colwellbacteria bacterium]